MADNETQDVQKLEAAENAVADRRRAERLEQEKAEQSKIRTAEFRGAGGIVFDFPIDPMPEDVAQKLANGQLTLVDGERDGVGDGMVVKQDRDSSMLVPEVVPLTAGDAAARPVATTDVEGDDQDRIDAAKEGENNARPASTVGVTEDASDTAGTAPRARTAKPSTPKNRN
jgi:hypothetical protein